MATSNFEKIKEKIQKDLEEESKNPDSGFHLGWIMSKLNTLKQLNSFDDLASEEEIKKNENAFDSKIQLSRLFYKEGNHNEMELSSSWERISLE